MREGGQILAEVLKELSAKVQPGLRASELEKLARELISSRGAEPAFLGYNKFPGALCVSINDEIVHGIAGEKILEEGDIVSLDCGVLYRGFYTDSALTVGVGTISKDKQKLIDATRQALEIGIAEVRPGATLGDVGSAIQKHLESNRLAVFRELIGHGIGKKLHEEPEVPNYGKRGKGEILVPGMVIAIEPMATTGKKYGIKDGQDGYAFVTEDGSPAAHFEHTVAVTETGCLVLTQE